MTTSNTKNVLLFLFLGLTCKHFGQNYLYSVDSISGFKEETVLQNALNLGLTALEKEYMLHAAKRAFIKRKYGFKSYSKVSTNEPQEMPGDACYNDDFEDVNSPVSSPDTIPSWKVESGLSTGICSPATYSAAGIYTVYTAPVFDPVVNQMVSSYFGSSNVVPSGNSFVKLNDSYGGSDETKLSRVFMAGQNNSSFHYAYLPVLDDSNHPCCNQPSLLIIVVATNTLTNISTTLSCETVSIISPGNIYCQNPNPTQNVLAFAGYNPSSGQSSFYMPWTTKSIDLSPYFNNVIEIDVIIKDCTLQGHAGYVYFDSKCGSSFGQEFYNGSNSASANDSIINLLCCSMPSTVYIPFPFAQVSGTTPFSYNCPILSTSYPGTFTITAISGPNCSVTTKTLHVNYNPISVLYTKDIICLGETITMTVTGGNSCLWSTGDTNTVIAVSPTISTNYSVSTINQACAYNTTKYIQVNPCLGINEGVGGLYQIKIYPNPNTNKFILECTIADALLNIYDTFGKIIYQQTVSGGENKIVTDLSPGIYFYQLIKNDSNIKSGRLKID